MHITRSLKMADCATAEFYNKWNGYQITPQI
jgi:hypothetical protein